MARGRLGIELYEPFEVGPLQVDHLLLTLPNLKFPVDLSGGVRPFRNRRGELESLTVTASLEALSRWMEGALANLQRGARRPSLWRTSRGLGVGFVVGEAAWACELVWACSGTDLRLVVHHPRAAGVSGPAIAQVLRVLDSLLSPFGSREGRVVTLHRVGEQLARWVLPAMGARSPVAGDVLVGPLEGDGDEVRVELGVNEHAAAPTADAMRATELATLVREGDDLLVDNDPEGARAAYVAALEKAPRHPEITRSVAELDAWVSERAEAALGLLVEALPATSAGLVGAELLAQVRDYAGARQAVDAAARNEPYGPVAALEWLRLYQLLDDTAARREALDLAVASSPSLEGPRWARLEERCRSGEIDAALSDAQHLEAAVSGAEARHDVVTRAAAVLLEYGYIAQAGQLFERALRYVPSNAKAALGLAQSMIATGSIRRAARLLERAAGLGDDALVTSEACLELAKLMAVEFRDLPQGIARVRQVVAESPHVVEARAREGQWRAELGDLAGASLAYSRLREACELDRARDTARAADWLRQAASFEREVKRDLAATERHLAVALRLRPHDERIAGEYRRAAAALAGPEAPEALQRVHAEHDDETAFTYVGDEQLAEELRAQVLAAPADEQARRRLVEVFERLHRDEELFALLSAQREEADEALARQLKPHLVRVLRRLVTRMREEGRLAEQDLYQRVLDDLSQRA